MKQIFNQCIKNIFVILLITAIIANTAYASVIISQVIYNPEGTESGGEAVELFNSGDEDVDISGWTLKTEASNNDATIPESTTICPQCYYLIADTGWNESRDNETWPLADHEELLNLFNSNSGIAIVENSTIIDAVGWGDEAEIEEGLYEGSPADEADEGYALLRDKDTDDNDYDFSQSYPSFRSSSNLGTGTHSEDISISFNTQENILINSVNITPDEGLSGGIQIFPNLGGVKEITVTADVDGEVGNITAAFNNITKVMSGQGSIHSCIFELGQDLPPGKYNITIKAGNSEKTVEFEYKELVAIKLSGNIDFQEIDAGSSIEEEITVENIGNAAVDLGFSATTLMGDGSAISQKNIEYSLGDEFFQMSSNTQIRKANLNPGEKKEIEIRINIPETADGEYSGRITVVGIGIDDN